MSNDCAASVQICALRIARLGADGVPAPGATNLYVTDVMASLGITPVVSDGEDIEEKNGCGTAIVDYVTPGTYRRLDIELTLLVPDPELTELIAGGSVLTLAGDTVGHQFPALRTTFNENGVSLEGWSKAILDGQLATTKPYWRWVLPKANKWRIGQRELANGNVATVLTGEGYENDNWYDGPANDWYTLTDDDLTGPMGYVRDTGIPATACGYQTLAAS